MPEWLRCVYGGRTLYELQAFIAQSWRVVSVREGDDKARQVGMDGLRMSIDTVCCVSSTRSNASMGANTFHALTSEHPPTLVCLANASDDHRDVLAGLTAAWTSIDKSWRGSTVLGVALPRVDDS